MGLPAAEVSALRAPRKPLASLMTPIRNAEARDYLRLWLSPAVLLPVMAMVLGLYVASQIQSERHAALAAKVDEATTALRLRVEQVERDYQRRDVLAEVLRSMDVRLSAIERDLRNIQATQARPTR